MRAKGTFQGITFKDYPGGDNQRVTRAHFKQSVKNIKQKQSVKDAFALAVSLWKELTKEERLSWDDAAYGVEKEHGEKVWQPELSGYHKMISKNVRLNLEGKPLKRVPY